MFHHIINKRKNFQLFFGIPSLNINVIIWCHHYNSGKKFKGNSNILMYAKGSFCIAKKMKGLKTGKFFDKHQIRYLSSKIELESFINYWAFVCAAAFWYCNDIELLNVEKCVNAISFWLISGTRKLWEFEI